MSTRYLNGKAETVIDNRPGNLDLDQIENQIRFCKDLQLSKLALHLCHLETLVKYAREYLNQPKFDQRRMG